MKQLTDNAALKKLHASILLALIMIAGHSRAEAAFRDVLTGGTFDFSARYRFEHVDDELAAEKAKASTIRSTLGYTTGPFHDFDARLLVQDVRTVVPDDFNDGTGRPNAKTRYAVVPDPSDADFIEGYIGFSGLPSSTLKLGRQLLANRSADAV